MVQQTVLSTQSRQFSLSQEGLKALACVLMLLDHAAAALVSDFDWYLLLRGAGRAAFPIFCYLLCEGAAYTRSPKKYALRLGLGVLLSEIPFDYALFGGITWQHQSVMVTLLLGFAALMAIRDRNPGIQLLLIWPFVLMGELMMVDYGGHGVLLIALLGIVREMKHGKLLQLGAIAGMCALIPSISVRLGPVEFSLELLGILSAVPILLYRGRKLSRAPALQWGFYLFYPVHLGLIGLIS